ncbi:MAG: hypothetical protein IPO01_04320 [Chitinophagaceae bacterium]|nr:hypothetical protein [Chitinophagaceae bacterium]MBK8785251.1 hypothetical protein [Chitinophagaceae bacterium]MBK9484447.1 hypothetical protein [Chitinophagaceae bacterium]
MKCALTNAQIKDRLENSAKTIYDEVAQNLCLIKLILARNESGQFHGHNENYRRCLELVSNSITQLRQVADSLNEIKNEIQPE